MKPSRNSRVSLKIAMLSPVLGEAFGQERVLRDSAILLRNAGHRIYLVGERQNGKLPLNDGYQLIESLNSLHSLSPLAEVRRVRSELLKSLELVSPDVVHLIDQFDYRIHQDLCSRYPVVLTSHTMAPTCPSSCRVKYAGDGGACEKKSGFLCVVHNKSYHCLDGFKSDLHRIHAIHNYLLRRKTLRKAQAIIAISRYVEESLLLDGWPREKVRLVYNPVSVPEDVPLVEEGPKNLFVVASRLVPHKGVGFVIKALAKIRDLDWDLWICGDGVLKNELIRLTEEVGLSARISFKGALPYSEIQQVIASCLALIQPNIGPEPFGLSAAEASAMGVPVVATSVPALNEIIEHEVNGLLAQRNNVESLALCLRRILTDSVLCGRLKRNAPELIRNRFSPEAHLQGTVQTYVESIKSFNASDPPLAQMFEASGQ